MPPSVPTRIRILQSDITKLDVDAIVNAASQSLLGGGGVDGAIHRAAGPGLLAECRKLNGCPAGHAKLTAGHNLKARHVIHTVGPVYDGGGYNEPELLRSCYTESLKLAHAAALQSIAFPCISTGIFGYPKQEACDIAVSTIIEWLSTHDLPREITFCCFSPEDAQIYHTRLASP